MQQVNCEKGPDYAEVGNYSSAGSANIQFFKEFPQNFFQVELGMYGFTRAVFGVSLKLGSGTLLYGGEANYDNGPWKHPDAYAKFNGLLTYSQGDASKGFSVTSRAYHGKWNSSDQIPESAIPPACARWLFHIYKVRYRFGTYTVSPNYSRTAIPEPRFLPHRRAITMASNGLITVRR